MSTLRGTPETPGSPPGLFREEALSHHLRAEDGQGLVRVAPPWTWALLAAALAGLGAALMAACLGKVEVNGRARGILRPTSGIRVVVSQLDGTVSQLEARSGQTVEAGHVLVRVEAPPVRAGLLEAERQLESVQTQFKDTSRLQDRAFEEQSRRVVLRLARLQETMQSQVEAVSLAERNLERALTLLRAGIQSPAEVDRARAALAQARSNLSQSEHAMEQASQERAALDHGRQESLWQRRQTVRTAEVRVEVHSLLLSQSVHGSPEPGTVEAMLVKPGEAVRAGQPLCKIIPRQTPLHVVSFLPEKDRAFVKAGDEVVLELDQLPYAEYGTARARVERISDDLASTFEIQEALGETPLPLAPCYRVELRLTDAQAPAKAGIAMRSGMLLNARFTLRRQRFITLVLDPLRKWLR